jgi:hypothetical protein
MNRLAPGTLVDAPTLALSYGGGYGDPYGQQPGGYGQQQGGWYGGQAGYEPPPGGWPPGYQQPGGWGPPPEQRPPERRPPRRGDNTGTVVVGIFLVLLGAWFLVRDQIDIDIGEYWPFAVVIVGVLMILGAFIRRPSA